MENENLEQNQEQNQPQNIEEEIKTEMPHETIEKINEENDAQLLNKKRNHTEEDNELNELRKQMLEK